MRDTKTIQADLDAAQADLQKTVSELKHLVQDKLEGPKHVIEVVEVPISFVRKHAVWFAVGATFAIGLMIGRAVHR